MPCAIVGHPACINPVRLDNVAFSGSSMLDLVWAKALAEDAGEPTGCPPVRRRFARVPERAGHPAQQPDTTQRWDRPQRRDDRGSYKTEKLQAGYIDSTMPAMIPARNRGGQAAEHPRRFEYRPGPLAHFDSSVALQSTHRHGEEIMRF